MLHFYFHLIISITLVFQCCPSIKMNPFMRFKPHLATTRVSMLYTIVICAMFPRSSQVDSGAMEADVPLNLCKPLYHSTRFVQLRGLFLKVVGAKQTQQIKGIIMVHVKMDPQVEERRRRELSGQNRLSNPLHPIQDQNFALDRLSIKSFHIIILGNMEIVSN